MKALLFFSFCVAIAHCHIESNDIWQRLDNYERENVFGIKRNDIDTGDTSEEGKHWALIVAGSSEWFNYRHQVRKLCVFCSVIG